MRRRLINAKSYLTKNLSWFLLRRCEEQIRLPVMTTASVTCLFSSFRPDDDESFLFSRPQWMTCEKALIKKPFFAIMSNLVSFLPSFFEKPRSGSSSAQLSCRSRHATSSSSTAAATRMPKKQVASFGRSGSYNNGRSFRGKSSPNLS